MHTMKPKVTKVMLSQYIPKDKVTTSGIIGPTQAGMFHSHQETNTFACQALQVCAMIVATLSANVRDALGPHAMMMFFS